MDNSFLIEELKKKLGENWNKVVSLYQVGLTDGSALSDIDLFVVVKEASYKKIITNVIIYLGSTLKFDLRKIVTEKEFVDGYQYEPYACLELITGQELRSEKRLISPEDEGLVKLSAMFFTSFLRNFYWLREKKAGTQEILINLNDFAYVPLWFSDAPSVIAEFNQSVQELRKRYPEVSDKECQDTLDRGIEYAWELIAILNNKLKSKLKNGDKSKLFLGREPTICISETLDRCRELTEKNLSGKHRLKILYLPEGFQLFLINSLSLDDHLSNFITKYREVNLRLRCTSLGTYIKNIGKKMATLLLYFKYLLEK
jgi:hypothetical protein